jgi:signal transduction histidine kinase
MAKDRFFAMMTHELRTPLAAIMATTDLLVNKLYDTPEELEHFLKMIQDEGNQLMELINDVLDLKSDREHPSKRKRQRRSRRDPR